MLELHYTFQFGFSDYLTPEEDHRIIASPSYALLEIEECTGPFWRTCLTIRFINTVDLNVFNYLRNRCVNFTLETNLIMP